MNRLDVGLDFVTTVRPDLLKIVPDCHVATRGNWGSRKLSCLGKNVRPYGKRVVTAVEYALSAAVDKLQAITVPVELLIPRCRDENSLGLDGEELGLLADALVLLDGLLDGVRDAAEAGVSGVGVEVEPVNQSDEELGRHEADDADDASDLLLETLGEPDDGRVAVLHDRASLRLNFSVSRRGGGELPREKREAGFPASDTWNTPLSRRISAMPEDLRSSTLRPPVRVGEARISRSRE